MLREISAARQNSDRKKRWFTDTDMDLFVWFENQVPIAFQLSYDKRELEHALSWSYDAGTTHSRVDNGENAVQRYKQAPMLRQNTDFNLMQVARNFLSNSTLMETSLADFIFARLLEQPCHCATASDRDTAATSF